MAETLFHKVWNAHTVRTLPSGQTQLFVGLHLVHEVTSPQAFDMLRQHGWRVALPGADVRDRRPHRPHRLQATAVSRSDGGGDDHRARAQLSRLRHQPVVGRQSGPGHRARDRTAARADAAGDDHRVRRQPHVDPRRGRRHCVRDRHLAGARRPRFPVPRARAIESAAHRRQRPARLRRVRQRRHPDDHPSARRARRQRLRLRVRRHHARPDVDRRADDRVQYVD